MAINGNSIIVISNGMTIAGVKSSEVQTSAETVEVASPSDGAWKHYMAKRKGWEVNVGYLVAAVSNLTDLLQVGATYTLRMKANALSLDTLQGDAVLTKCRITATRGNLVTGQFSFVGTGPLAQPTTT